MNLQRQSSLDVVDTRYKEKKNYINKDYNIQMRMD